MNFQGLEHLLSSYLGDVIFSVKACSGRGAWRLLHLEPILFGDHVTQRLQDLVASCRLATGHVSECPLLPLEKARSQQFFRPPCHSAAPSADVLCS